MATRQGKGTMVLAAVIALAIPAAALGAAPTDPQAAGQQPLQIIRVGQALDLAGVPPADVRVLIPDTGLDLDHPDLASRTLPLLPNADLIGNACAGPNDLPDGDPNHPAGCSDHGTQVAGVLGATWNNGVGGAGIAPNARFIPMRTCWDNDECFEFVQANAFNQAIDNGGARVVSMSWLTGAPSETDFVQAIASHPNTLFVAIPSGNGGATNADPEAASRPPCSLNFTNILCVTTSAPNDGLSCGDFGATLVDVAAPTENSVTTTNGGGFGATGCATSFAAPTAAGVATILFGLFPAATPAQVRQAIIDGARDVPAWQGKSVSGGILDAVGALQVMAGGGPPVPTLGLDVGARARQEGERLRVVATCTVDCELTVQAKGQAGGDPFSSRKTQETLAAGVPTVVKLDFTRRARRNVKDERGRATITATATSSAGDATDADKVKLKR